MPKSARQQHPLKTVIKIELMMKMLGNKGIIMRRGVDDRTGTMRLSAGSSTEALGRWFGNYFTGIRSNSIEAGALSQLLLPLWNRGRMYLGVFLLVALSRTMTKLRISALSKLIITHNGLTENRTSCTWIRSRRTCFEIVSIGVSHLGRFQSPVTLVFLSFISPLDSTTPARAAAHV